MSEIRQCPLRASFSTQGGNPEADSNLVAMSLGTPAFVKLNDDGTNDFSTSCGLIKQEGKADMRECALIVLARIGVLSPEVAGQCLQSQADEA